MCRELNKEPVVVINRSHHINNDLIEYCQSEKLEVIGTIPDSRKIAECYAEGELVFDRLPEYRELFLEIADNIKNIASQKRKVNKSNIFVNNYEKTPESREFINNNDEKHHKRLKEIVIISGKGGTGGKHPWQHPFHTLEVKMLLLLIVMWMLQIFIYY